MDYEIVYPYLFETSEVVMSGLIAWCLFLRVCWIVMDGEFLPKVLGSIVEHFGKIVFGLGVLDG